MAYLIVSRGTPGRLKALCVCILQTRLSHTIRWRIFRNVHPVKIQISLRIRAVWSESSLGVFWITKDAESHHADNEYYDQTAWKRRLI